MRTRHLIALVLASLLLLVCAGAAAEPPEPRGSLFAHTPLAAGEGALSVGGGLAVVLPMVLVEGGVGLGAGVDLVGRYASVLGLLHIPEVGVRWAPARLGDVQVGVRLTAAGTLFGLKADHVNLSSTLYLAPDVGLTWTATPHTRVVVGLGAELDLVDLRVVDDEDETEAVVRYDATIGHLGLQTTFTEDLDVFANLRVRVPTETTAFYALPMLEAGATWTF